MAGTVGRIRVGVDAMGGDQGPGVVIRGALDALRETDERISVLLVGDDAVLRTEIAGLDPGGAFASRLEIRHAAESVAMGEEGAQSVRRKRDSSLAVGMKLMKEGEADAFFSAGHTGATVAAALLGVGRIPGVHRPALATLVPADTPLGVCVMLDVGATADCKPVHLRQFGVMGDIYARHIMGIAEPRVGLLNIGEESSKGNELARESHELLARSALKFVGNVEGRDIFGGAADVVVTDGFTGNVVLKFVESVYGWVGGIFRREVRTRPLARLGALFLVPTLNGLKRRLDYEEYGGAPLLGVNGVCIIGHGRSSPRAVMNGIKMGARFVDHGLNEEIRTLLCGEREQNVG